MLSDPLAVPILGVGAAELRADAAAHPERRSMRWFICARSRLAEDVTASAVTNGARQLIILGAGLDTFGYRNPHPALRVVELDHPATQEWKLELLRRAGIDARATRHHPVDFERDDLAGILRDSVDVRRPVMVWWLGVTPYLTPTAVTATLLVLAGLPSVAVVFDHASPVADLPADEHRRHQRRRDRVAALGEPWLSEYRPLDLAEHLAAIGFDRATPVDERHVILRALGRQPEEPNSSNPARTHLMLATRGEINSDRFT